jgi:hypothetical protein
MRVPLNRIYYEVPGGTSGGGGGTATPPAPAQSTPQPGAPGQGQDQGNGFRQTYFPNVPDEQWSIIEPHISGVNRHVTQLEQRYAPFRGYTPEAIQGLAGFVQAFDQDPANQWVALARTLQQNGHLTDLDVDYLADLVAGKVTDEGAEPGQNGPGDNGGLPPEVIQQLQAMQARIDELEGGFTQQQQAQRQRMEDAALNHQMTHIKTELKNAGFTDEQLDDRALLGQYIAHRGNAAAVVQTLSNMRTTMLNGYVQDATQRTSKDRDLDTSGGVPKGTGQSRQSRTGRSFLSEASAGAEQFLKNNS